MKKFIKRLFFIPLGIIFIYALLAFAISDPKPDYMVDDLSNFEKISLSELSTNHIEEGKFKSVVKLQATALRTIDKEFYGQAIYIKNNENIDQILIGVTNNLISRIEIWKDQKLIDVIEKGFVRKMTYGQKQKLAIQFSEYSNTYPVNVKSGIRMQMYHHTPFWGSVANISCDLSKYGDLSGEKEISVFAKSIESDRQPQINFSNFRVWKNFSSFD